MPADVGRLKRRAADAWQQRVAGAMTGRDPNLSDEQRELADLYQLAYTRLAELSSDPDVRDVMVRQVVTGRGDRETVTTEVWSTDEWINAVFEFLLTFALSGGLDEDTPIDVIKDEALAYVRDARNRQLRRTAAPSPRMELLPPRELVQRLRYRVTSGLMHGGEPPPAIGRLPRPEDAARLRRDAILEATAVHDQQWRDVREFERELRAAAQRRRQQRGIEVTTGPGGTVSAGPRRMKRGRKRGGRGKKKR